MLFGFTKVKNTITLTIVRENKILLMKKTILLLGLVLIINSIKGQDGELMMPATGDREQLIQQQAFSLSYNSSYVQPSWVTYKITVSDADRTEINGKYKPNPIVTTRSADKKDYSEGGYLMAQYINYFDIQKGKDAVEESFYMTNITPMKLAFHKHIWLKCEDLIRLWLKTTDALHIITGPVLTESPFPTIGKNNVSVPKRFYKVVYDSKNQKAIGFIFKNGISSGTLKSYAVSIDEIEDLTGIDFLSSLPDDIEEKVESETDYEFWNFELEEKL